MATVPNGPIEHLFMLVIATVPNVPIEHLFMLAIATVPNGPIEHLFMLVIAIIRQWFATVQWSHRTPYSFWALQWFAAIRQWSLFMLVIDLPMVP